MELRIKDELKKSKLKTMTLADKVDITRPNMTKIINGKLTPSIQTLEKVAAVLGVPIWQLFARSENSLNGYVEFKGTIYKIQSSEDLKKLLELV